MTKQTELTGPLVKMLRQMGIVTLRLNSGKLRVRGAWMTLCPIGTADIVCFQRNRVIWLECKTLQGKLRDSQKQFRESVTALGHEFYEIRSIDEGLEAVRQA